MLRLVSCIQDCLADGGHTVQRETLVLVCQCVVMLPVMLMVNGL